MFFKQLIDGKMLLFHIQDHDLNPGKEEILAFVNDNFFEEGNELEEWTPDDWTEEPTFLERIVDPGIRFCDMNLNATKIGLFSLGLTVSIPK